MSSRIPSRDFLAQRALGLQHRCDKALAGRALSNPGGIETWAKEAPPPPSDLLLHIPGTVPALVARHVECGRKSEALGIKRGPLCPFNRVKSWRTARVASGACNSHEGVVLVGNSKVSAPPPSQPQLSEVATFSLSGNRPPSGACAKLRAGVNRDSAAALSCK